MRGWLYVQEQETEGKRQRQEELAPSSLPINSAGLICSVAVPADLLKIRDERSGLSFLVDTGASVSLLPHSSKKVPSNRPLKTADGKLLPSWGTRKMTLSFGNRTFEWTFILASVSMPILGIDFLSRHKLMVDTDGRSLLHSPSSTPVYNTLQEVVQCTNAVTAAVDLGSLDVHPSIQWLLNDYKDVMGERLGDIKPRHGVEHHIVTTGPPVYAKARRLDPVKLQAAQEEFRQMEAAGIIRRSSSAWASPLHMVEKSDSCWRPCGDYRALNNATVPDRYPVPHVHDFSARLHGCTVFSKIDLVKGYYQIPVAAADIHKTCVTTPFGAWEWLYMPFGLRNAGSTFQRMMDRLADGLDFCFTYLDDLLVASASLAQHTVHLRRVMERLKDFGLIINPSKCDFAKPNITFLGHEVSAAGIAPLSRHLEAINNFPTPVDKPGLQRFLGLINYFRRFIPAAATVLRPLTDGLRGKPADFAWTDRMTIAFNAAKAALSTATRLQHPVPGARLAIASDASQCHVGGVLQQWVGGAWAPLAFFSKKLNPAEEKYSTFDRELLAAFATVKHFRFLLEGRPFTIFTDHKPLASAVHRVSPPASARQQRHLSFLSEFTSDVVYLPGLSNAAADALSRPISSVSATTPPASSGLTTPPATLPWIPTSLTDTNTPTTAAGAPTDHSAFLAAQQADADCISLLRNPQFEVQTSPSGVWASYSAPTPRLLVPAAFRRQVFDSIHGLHHPGVRATRRLITRAFLWSGMNTDINKWATTCLKCQSSKITRHSRSAVEEIPIPVRRFSHIHLDLVGPLQSSEGHTYLLTIIDRTTRWPEAVPLTNISADTCLRAFVTAWITRFGAPSTITTDQGTQFTSTLWSNFCKELGIEQIFTTPYHPQSNGMVERFHRRLKAALRARDAASTWVKDLPWVMLGLRANPMDDSGTSAAEMVYGSALSLPSSFVDTRELPDEKFLRRLHGVMERMVPPPSAPQPHPTYIDKRLYTQPFVYVRRDEHVAPLTPLYRGPYKVLERGPKVFKVQIGEASVSISVDRLKPVLSESVIIAAKPPQCGRPPAKSQQRQPPKADAPKRRGRPPASDKRGQPACQQSGCPSPAVRPSKPGRRPAAVPVHQSCSRTLRPRRPPPTPGLPGGRVTTSLVVAPKSSPCPSSITSWTGPKKHSVPGNPISKNPPLLGQDLRARCLRGPVARYPITSLGTGHRRRSHGPAANSNL